MYKNNKIVTQEDIAQYAGVSRSVVSYVINNASRPVAEETKLKVIDAINELGYRPNNPNAFVSKNIGIIIADVFMFRRPFYSDILAGIHSSAYENGYHINFIRFFNDLKDPLLFEELIHTEKISGLLLISLDQIIKDIHDTEIIKKLKVRIKNVVCIEWSFDGLSSINFSRQEASYKACKYLLDNKNTTIHYIGPLDGRILGFHQALIEADMLDNLNNSTYSATSQEGYDICQRFIDNATLPSAILGGTDEVSIGILNCLYENNIVVPQDISIISIDNIDMASFTNPPLTTVNVETWEMGRFAVKTLIDNSGNKEGLATTTLFPTNLIIRKSCK